VACKADVLVVQCARSECVDAAHDKRSTGLQQLRFEGTTLTPKQKARREARVKTYA